jgi:hypothetical protein
MTHVNVTAEVTISRTTSNSPKEDREYISLNVTTELPDGSRRLTRLQIPLAEFALILTAQGGVRVHGTEALRQA